MTKPVAIIVTMSPILYYYLRMAIYFSYSERIVEQDLLAQEEPNLLDLNPLFWFYNTFSLKYTCCPFLNSNFISILMLVFTYRPTRRLVTNVSTRFLAWHGTIAAFIHSILAVRFPIADQSVIDTGITTLKFIAMALPGLTWKSKENFKILVLGQL